MSASAVAVAAWSCALLWPARAVAASPWRTDFVGDDKLTRLSYLSTMAPGTRTRAAGPQIELPATVRVGLAEAERGETIALTEAELDQWAETGDFPERVDTWVASLESRRST